VIKYIHFLNLDIVAGVAATGILAERITQSHLPLSWWFVVPLSAWVVYTADRLIDVRLAPAEHPTFRHQFHARHASLLTVICVVAMALVVTVALMTFSPWMLIAAPLCAVFIVAHHVLQRATSRRFAGTLKDTNVILIYAFATWFIPLGLGGFSVTAVMALVTFTSIVTAIVLQLSISDTSTDTELGVSSSALEMGLPRARLLMRLCLGAATVISVAMFFLAVLRTPFDVIRTTSDVPLAIVLLCMCVCTALLPFAFGRLQRPHARLTSELILSLPYLLLFFPHT